MDLLKSLLKQPYWITALVLGVVLVGFPCVTVDKDKWTPHAPSTLVPIVVGIVLLSLSALAFGLSLFFSRYEKSVSGGVDLRRVREHAGTFSTTVSGCEVRVAEGRIEEYDSPPGAVIVLPCNEYFDDRCVDDKRSALGAYVNRLFEGQSEAFVSLMKSECRKTLGLGTLQKKTETERAESFGAGHCVLLLKPLGRSVPIALVSSSTQRAGEGLAARISYLFEGMRELVKRLADARITEVTMPVLGAGHGRIDPPLAFVGLLLAIAEAARYGQGGQRLQRVTIIVFKRDESTPAEVNSVVVRRALALIGSRE